MRKNDVVIVSYALLVRDFKPLSAIEWDTLFLDEAQFLILVLEIGLSIPYIFSTYSYQSLI